MVTNINLAAPEGEKKTLLTGKTSLVLSVVLLLITVGAYVGVIFLSGYYLGKKNQIENQVQTEKARISGPEYAEVSDFQERLNLLDKVLEDHVYFDNYVKSFSKYILPETRLSSFEWKGDTSEITIAGTTTNFDTLSKELILLKNSPIVQSVEFKSATESKSAEGQSGVTFGLTAKIKKEELNK
jgi:Tfp pilus assembly protein PilN